MAKRRNYTRTPYEAIQMRAALLRADISSVPTLDVTSASLTGSNHSAVDDDFQVASSPQYDKKPLSRKAADWAKENLVLSILLGLFSALIILCLTFSFGSVGDIARLEVQIDTMIESVGAISNEMVSKDNLANELSLLKSSSSFELLIHQKEIENRLEIIELEIDSMKNKGS